jgi:hypothetical protein
MPMAEEFVNDDQRDETLTDAEAQIEATLFKQGQEYAARNQRSKAENKGRAESRAAIKSLGMNPSAYAQAVKLIKDLTPGELKDWKRDFELTLKVMGSKQRELFPAEQLAAEARIQRAKDKAAKAGRTKAEMDADSDANPRSDPTAGGAQIDLEEAIAAAPPADIGPGTYHSAPKGQGETIEEREAAEGEQALAEAAPSIAKPKPKSQSAKAAEKSRAAGIH